ncbi:hypothetical protein DPMN_095120 [Dreissena polymorpha]|uniref:Uncharacterized protein n=1 Tax=Dreissena polymorpha TaxID=45954 RepID=A0A9D4L5W7_DREPO|nr:hypothetical protein DPMN_095120 [Dreissena polymorpha]
MAEWSNWETFYSRTPGEKCPAPGGHVFKPTGIIFELVRDIIGTHCLTKFHEDWTINVASRVLKRKNAPPPDWTINVASRLMPSASGVQERFPDVLTEYGKHLWVDN